MKKLIIVIFTVSIIIFLIPKVTIAQNYISTNYILTDPVFGEAGPYMSSPNFNLGSVIGQTVTGESQSPNYILNSGFEYYAGQSVPSITLTLNTNAINIGNLNPNTLTTATTKSVVTINSNSEFGYNLYIAQNRNLTSANGNTIPPVNNGATTTTAALWNSNAYYGLGYDCTTSNTYISTVLSTNPIEFLTLGETSGTESYDLTGSGNNGTYTGGYTQGYPGPMSNSNLGNSTYFNGSNSYVNLPSSLILNSYNNYTYSGFFKTTSNGGILGYQTSPVGGGSGAWTPLAYIGINGKFIAANGGSSAYSVESTNPVNDGRWHSFTIEQNNSNTTLYLYIDGVLQGSTYDPISLNTSQTYNQIGVSDTSGAWPEGNGGWFYFKGQLADIAIYNTVLTPTQITNIYNSIFQSNNPLCNTDFISSSYYRQLSTTPVEIASYSAETINPQTVNVGYQINVGNLQAAGVYNNVISFTISGNF